MNPSTLGFPDAGAVLTPSGRWIVLTISFLGWLFAGCHMAVTSIAMRPAAISLLGQSGEVDVARYLTLNRLVLNSQPISKEQSDITSITDQDRARWMAWDSLIVRWFTWFQCAFLFGAAAGGLVFGWLGDRIGRSKALAASVLSYSVMSGVAGLVTSPWQLIVVWFLASTGVGGIWPNGVALISEAWSTLSRPMTAGVIGTAANVGIFVMSTVAARFGVTPDTWRWFFSLGACPAVLGLVALTILPESPRWIASKQAPQSVSSKTKNNRGIFRPPLLAVTLVGIILATIPVFGGWGSANWMVPWADSVGAAMNPPNVSLKANVQQARSITGIVGSFLGGWFGSLLGRRRAYFVISLLCLFTSQYAFWFVKPLDSTFLIWVGALGFFSGLYFGWLPLFLPELFPTAVRSTGAGVCFNFGRITTAISLFGTGAIVQLFGGDFARIGQVTSLIFAIGLIAIPFAPKPDEDSCSLADPR